MDQVKTAFDNPGVVDVVLGKPKTRAEAVAMWFRDPVRLQAWIDANESERWVLWNYEVRHPGHGDQSVHNPHKGAAAVGGGSGLGEFVPGQPRKGAGDSVPFPQKGTRQYDDFMAGSAGKHVVTDASGNIKGWTPERQALHDEIVAAHVLKVPKAEGQPEFIMMGGGSGAGKTTIRKAGSSEDLPAMGAGTHVEINADDIKIGGEVGGPGIPEFRQSVMGTDDAVGKAAASFTHEESAYLATRVQAAAVERGQNIVLDGTGDSGADKLAAKIQAPKDAGYDVKGVYITIPTEEAVSRVAARGAKPVYPGANYGRLVPVDVTTDIHIAVSRVFPEIAQRGVFSSLELWDNSGKSPSLVFSSKKGGVVSASLWDTFLAKGKPLLSTERGN